MLKYFKNVKVLPSKLLCKTSNYNFHYVKLSLFNLFSFPRKYMEL